MLLGSESGVLAAVNAGSGKIGEYIVFYILNGAAYIIMIG